MLASLNLPAILLGISPKSNLVDVFLLAILAPLIWRGHKWAMVSMMVLWTLEQGHSTISSLYDCNLPNLHTAKAVIWWFIGMSFFSAAYRVEVSRSRQSKSEN
ncbi:MAG: hypothetical protein EOO38_13220 [Cytophagaceae bacterium]|nr:MAG: hypothetical protein EOO38_13220 [Cytophagaceae bacterium]